MKNSYLIRDIGPHLLGDYHHLRRPTPVFLALWTGLVFSVLLFGILYWMKIQPVHTKSPTASHPIVCVRTFHEFKQF